MVQGELNRSPKGLLTVESLPSLTHPDIAKLWKRLYPAVTATWADYDTLCIFEDVAQHMGYVPWRFQVLVFSCEGTPFAIHPVHFWRQGWKWPFGNYCLSVPLPAPQSAWAQMPAVLPKPYTAEDTHFLRQRGDAPPWVLWLPANVASLEGGWDAYLMSLPSRYRRALRLIIERNADLAVTTEPPASTDRHVLWALWYAWWRDRLLLRDRNYAQWGAFEDQQVGYPYTLAAAARRGALVTLYAYWQERCVAYIHNVIEGDVAIFYYCVRDVAMEDRSLGNFMLIESIRHMVARNPRVRYYDLSATPMQYKRKFVNRSFEYPVWTIVGSFDQLAELREAWDEPDDRFLPPYLVGDDVVTH